MINIAFFGEAMHELSNENQPSFGGDTYNSAVYLKRMIGKQGEVYFISAVGCDELSNQAEIRWQSQGLNLRYLLRSNSKTLGAYGITTDINGERIFKYDRNDSAAKLYFYLTESHQFLTALQQNEFDYVYLSAISLAILDLESKDQLISGIEAYKLAGGKVIFDSNYRSILWQDIETTQAWYKKAFQCADILFVTNEDHYGVFGDCSKKQLVEFYQQFPQVLIVIKQGADDTLLLFNHTLTHYPVVPVDAVVDTTAAGDAFAAGFLADFIFHQQYTSAVITAQQLAAQVIGSSGAIVHTTIVPISYKHEDYKYENIF